MKEADTRAEPELVPPRVHSNVWIVLVVLTLGYFMILVDTSIINVALPSMEKGLNAGFDQVLWVVNAYILAYAVLLITAARLGDVFGPRLLFLLGLGIFTLASAALLTPQTLVLLSRVFPAEKRGAAFGILSAVAGLAVVVGPTVGGWLVTDFSWQAIFFLNVPIGIGATLAAILLLPEIHSNRSPALDLPGVALSSAGLTALIFALVESQRYAWGPILSLGTFSLGSSRWSVVSIYSLLVYSAALLALFVWWETRARQPLLPLSLFRDRNYSISNLVYSLVGFPLAIFIVLSLFLQSALAFSAIDAGLALIPASIGIMVAGSVAGRLSDRINGKYTLLAGLIVSAVGIVLTAFALTLSVTAWHLVLPLAITGIGMGFVFAPLTTLAMRDVPPALAGAASGFLFTSRQLGQSLGSAVVGSVLANRVASELPLQARVLASRVPAAFRKQFVAGFDRTSHRPQNFGVGQTHGATFASEIVGAVARHLTALDDEVFGQAFLSATRPVLAICAGVLLLGAVIARGLRGGRSADAARQAPLQAEEDAA